MATSSWHESFFYPSCAVWYFQYFRFLSKITTKAKQLTIVVAAPAPNGQQQNKQQIKVWNISFLFVVFLFSLVLCFFPASYVMARNGVRFNLHKLPVKG